MTAQEVYITFTQHEGVRDSCDTWCNQIVARLNLFLHNLTLPFQSSSSQACNDLAGSMVSTCTYKSSHQEQCLCVVSPETTGLQHISYPCQLLDVRMLKKSLTPKPPTHQCHPYLWNKIIFCFTWNINALTDSHDIIG
jgi:hypothetical protein